MDDEGGLGFRNWGYCEPSSRGNLGLRLLPSTAERDVTPPLPANSRFVCRHCATPEPSLQMDHARDGWIFHNFDSSKNAVLRDGCDRHCIDVSKNELLRDGWFRRRHPSFGFPPEPLTIHNLRMLQHHDPRPKDDKVSAVKETICTRNESPTKKISKKPKKVTAPNSEVPIGKVARKNTDMVINGFELDISRIPTPVCSCTGNPQRCYRWGIGGWQSACCTTSISLYPLPVNTKRRGARIAGRQMSHGTFKKVLGKLAGEGYNLSNPIDLRKFWAKHGTNKFVTIR